MRRAADNVTRAVLSKVPPRACATISYAAAIRTDRKDERRRFVADPDVLAALGVVVEQLSDPNVRSLVIRHEHPEFEEAVKEGRREIEGPDWADESTFASHDADRRDAAVG